MATLYPIPAGEQMAGTPFFDDGEDEVDGTWQELISFTVPSDIVRKLTQAVVTCPWDGRFKVTLDDSVIASGRTGPADRNSPFFWNPPRQIAPDSEVKLLFKGAQGVPIGVKVEAFVMALDF